MRVFRDVHCFVETGLLKVVICVHDIRLGGGVGF